jgi:hypothetical protein
MDLGSGAGEGSVVVAAQAYQNWWRALEQDPDSRGVRVDVVDPEACRLDAVGIRFVSFDVF